MNITIKNTKEQEKMRIVGRLAADVLDMIEDFVKPGISTSELDQICHKYKGITKTFLFFLRII